MASQINPVDEFWLLLGMIASPIVLGLIFILFTPIALVMRLYGRDELRLRFETTKRATGAQEGEPVAEDFFKNQF